MGQRLFAATLAVLVTPLWPCATGSIRAEANEENLTVRVRASAPGATAALRDDIEFELLGELARRRCLGRWEAWSGGENEGDLRLELSIVEVRDETRREFSIADRVETADPDLEQRVQVFFEILLELRLVSVAENVVVLEDRFHVSHARRPLNRFEDPREEARTRVVRDTGRKVAARVCSLHPRKLEKLRRQAVEEAGAAASR